MKKTLALRVPDSIDHDRQVAHEHVSFVIEGLNEEIQNQYNLHPEDRL